MTQHPAKPGGLHQVGRVLRLSGTLLRDGWLIAGAVLALLLVLEFAYRAQVEIRRAVSGGEVREVLFPAGSPSWVEAYLEEELRTYTLGWRPFVYFRRAPFAGRFVNVDSSGRRVTPPSTSSAGPVVWLFGGSTMFGTFQRDSQTIASVLATQLTNRGMPSQVVNWGESGYVFTQEVVQLLLQLREGARPDVVVFYDGINDVVAALQQRAGIPQNEGQRARDFAFGRTVFSWDRDLAADGRALGALIGAASTRSQLFSRIRNTRTPPLPQRDPSETASEIVRTYVETVRLVEAAAHHYGFRPIYLWQPTLHASAKPLSPEESELMRRIEVNPFHGLVRQVHLQIASVIDSAMTGVAEGRFLNLAGLFAETPEPIFVDIIGHTVEAANPIVVERLTPLVTTALAPLQAGKSPVPTASGGP